MSAVLYVVPTPIGNLEDITLRAIRILSEVALIAAEDTRHSRVLLSHLGIRTKLISYHQHKKQAGVARILRGLEDGDVALISDAGTPSISDPGFELIMAVLKEGGRVEVLPGPSSVTAAVALAALPARGFIFMGFLPRRRTEMSCRLREVSEIPYSLVVFEAAHRLLPTLRVLREELGDRDAVAVKELSKLHEEVFRGTLLSIREQLQDTEPRGEWTLVVGTSETPSPGPSEEEIREALSQVTEQGKSGRDAVRMVAESLDVQRSKVYRVWVAMSRP